MMPPKSRGRTSTRRTWTALAAAALLAASVPALAQRSAQPSPRPAAPKPSPGVNSQAAAAADFQQRLQQYIKLRQDLGNKLRPLSSTANAAELAARQESLAAALRDVRKNARPGDLIPPLVAEQIRTTITDYFRQKDLSTKKAVLEEVPAVRPAINKTMPDSAALATVPGILLNNLPRLPDNLQYRFIGRHVILLDGDTRLIMDYLLDVLPPH
jgi:hypothetical protein